MISDISFPSSEIHSQIHQKMYSAFSKNSSKVFVNRNKPDRAQRTYQIKPFKLHFYFLRAGMVIRVLWRQNLAQTQKVL